MDNTTLIPTNTMSTTSFDVLTMDGIDDPLISINKLSTLDLDECYFATAVNFIKEANQNIVDAKKDLYKSISEATDQYVVLESFSDFFSKINDIINKFIQFIKSLVARFITHIQKLIKSDKYINSHKKEFDKFKDTDKFTMNGYTYTFDPNIPAAAASVNFNKDLFEDLYNSSKDFDFSVEGINVAIANMNNNEVYDEFRGNVLQKDYDISIGEWDTELFKVFRNDDLDTSEIEVDSTLVHKTLNRFATFNSYKKQVEADQKRIQNDYENVKKQVKEIVRGNGNLNMSAFIERMPQDMKTDIKRNNYTNQGIITGDLMYKLDLYTKIKVDQITEFSNIHTLAFSAKLDALKESYKQDRALLYTALLKVQRTDNARKEK